VPKPAQQKIRAVVAIDGSYREVSVREEFPSSVITFFAFGPLLFNLEELAKLDRQSFIAPEDLARLKNIQRFTLVLPTRDISREGMSLRNSIRNTLHDFFAAPQAAEKPLYASLRWILFRGWTRNDDQQWEIPTCPNEGCDRTSPDLS
jgi:hypothetical protein